MNNEVTTFFKKKQTWYFCLDFLLTKTYQVEMVVMWRKNISQRLLILKPFVKIIDWPSMHDMIIAFASNV